MTSVACIDYGALTPLLVKAIQEQQSIIQQQNKTINNLQKELCLQNRNYSWC